MYQFVFYNSIFVIPTSGFLWILENNSSMFLLWESKEVIKEIEQKKKIIRFSGLDSDVVTVIQIKWTLTDLEAFR